MQFYGQQIQIHCTSLPMTGWEKRSQLRSKLPNWAIICIDSFSGQDHRVGRHQKRTQRSTLRLSKQPEFYKQSIAIYSHSYLIGKDTVMSVCVYWTQPCTVHLIYRKTCIFAANFIAYWKSSTFLLGACLTESTLLHPLFLFHLSSSSSSFFFCFPPCFCVCPCPFFQCIWYFQYVDVTKRMLLQNDVI